MLRGLTIHNATNDQSWASFLPQNWLDTPTGQLAQPINTSHWFIQLSFNPRAVNQPICGWAWLVKLKLSKVMGEPGVIDK